MENDLKIRAHTRLLIALLTTMRARDPELLPDMDGLLRSQQKSADGIEWHAIGAALAVIDGLSD